MSVAEYIRDIFVNPRAYAKFWIAVATAVLSGIAICIPNSPWLTVVINFAGAFGVFLIPNKVVK